jgi:hypothetical protein
MDIMATKPRTSCAQRVETPFAAGGETIADMAISKVISAALSIAAGYEGHVSCQPAGNDHTVKSRAFANFIAEDSNRRR